METENIKTQAVPSLKLLELAKQKGRNLKCNSMIRLTGSEDFYSYEVININDECFIAWNVSEPLKPFFTRRPIYNFDSDGKKYQCQYLNVNTPKL